MGFAPPPEHVCRAFGLSVGDAEPLPDERAWRCGEVVLEPVHDRAHAVWLSRTMAALHAGVENSRLRVARPVGAHDGRWVIAGWRARRHLHGVSLPPEELGERSVLTAVKLHQITATLPRPENRGEPDPVVATAERLAFGEQHRRLDESRGGRLFEIVAPSRRPTSLQDQLVHGAVFGTVVFDDDASPGLVDFVPHFRPAEWGTALAAVDALAAGAADGELLLRWRHLPEWPQMLLRALLFRLAVHALTPHADPVRLDGLRRASGEVTELL